MTCIQRCTESWLILACTAHKVSFLEFYKPDSNLDGSTDSTETGKHDKRVAFFLFLESWLLHIYLHTFASIPCI